FPTRRSSDLGTAGTNGTNGATGATGAQGLDFNGPWDSSASYVANDAVSYLGSSWIAKQSNINSAPAEDSKWTLLSAEGAAGATGATGSPGTDGTNGTNGATGATGPTGL